MTLEYDLASDFDDTRFPPLIWPEDRDHKVVMVRWEVLGLDPFDARAKW